MYKLHVLIVELVVSTSCMFYLQVLVVWTSCILLVVCSS